MPNAPQVFVTIVTAALLAASTAFAVDSGTEGPPGVPDDNKDTEAGAPPPCPEDCDCEGGTQGATANGEGGEGPEGDSATDATTTTNPVRLFDGSLQISHTDIVVPGVFPIRFTRRYDSRSEYDSPVGYGWSHSFDLRLYLDDLGHASIRSRCGQIRTYDNNGSPASPDYAPATPEFGRHAGLRPATVGGEAGHIQVFASGYSTFFGADGRAVFQQDPQGNKLRFNYSESGGVRTRHAIKGISPYQADPTEVVTTTYGYRLSSVEEELGGGPVNERKTGRKLSFEYDPATGRLAYVESHDGRRVDFRYLEDLDGSGPPEAYRGNLAEVEGLATAATPGGAPTARLLHSYTYYAQTFQQFANADIHNLETFQHGQEMYPTTVLYDALDRVTRETRGGTSWAYDYLVNDGTGQVFTSPGSTPQVRAFLFDPSPADLFQHEESDVGRRVRRTISGQVASNRVDFSGALIGSGMERTAMTTYRFNRFGLMMQKIDPLGHQTVYIRGTSPSPPAGVSPRPYPTEIRTYQVGNTTLPNPDRRLFLAYDGYGDLIRRARLATEILPDNTEDEDLVVESWQFEGTTRWLKTTRRERYDTFTLDGSGVPVETGSSLEEFVTTREFYFDQDPLGGPAPDGLDANPLTPADVPKSIKSVARQISAGLFSTTTFEYDPVHGQLTKTILPTVAGPPAQDLTIGRSYYPLTDIIERRAQLHRVERFENGSATSSPFLARTLDYDPAGRLSKITDARSNDTLFAWSDAGQLLKRTNAEGDVVALTYAGPTVGTAEDGNPLDPDAAVPGRLLHEVDVGGKKRRFLRDQAGNLEATEREDGTWKPEYDYFIDSEGYPYQIRDAYSAGLALGLTHDIGDNVRKITGHKSAPTDIDLDAFGNLAQLRDEDGAEKRYTDYRHDSLDRRISTRRHDDGTNEIKEAFNYDAAGNVRQVIQFTDLTPGSVASRRTLYAYDGRSLLESVQQERGIGSGNYLVDYLYDEQGRLDKTINARGEEIDYEYYVWGGIEKLVTERSETDERTLTFLYNYQGGVTTISDTDSPASGDQIYTFAYDVADRLQTATHHYIRDTAPPELTYGYDGAGNRTSLTLTDGAETIEQRWVYDARNRLTSVETGPSGSGAELLALAYKGEPLGNDYVDAVTYRLSSTNVISTYTQQRWGTLDTLSVVHAGSGNTLLYLDYDETGFGDVDLMRERRSASGPLQTIDHAYDFAGRLSATNYPDPQAFEYPDPVDDFVMTYDAAGNRNATGYTHDTNNQITAAPGMAFPTPETHDEDGNLLGRGPHGFDWDPINRLERLKTSSGTTVADYYYDAFGRRLQKEISGGSTTKFLWDGDRLLAEYDDAGVRLRRYVYANGFAPVELADRSSGSEVLYGVHSDRLDAPRMLTNSSGATPWTASYRAFGSAGVAGSGGIRLRFPGQLYDSESGLHYNRFRYYDPSIGRYISADPIGQAFQTNLYTYALNSPTGVFDPLGLYVSNNTNRTVTVKPENGPMFKLPPKTTIDVSPDGVYDPGTGEWTKFRGKDWLPDNDVEIDPDLGPQCVGGPCRVLPEDKWKPGDPDELWPTPSDDDIYDPTKEDYWPDPDKDDCP